MVMTLACFTPRRQSFSPTGPDLVRRDHVTAGVIASAAAGNSAPSTSQPATPPPSTSVEQQEANGARDGRARAVEALVLALLAGRCEAEPDLPRARAVQHLADDLEPRRRDEHRHRHPRGSLDVVVTR